VIFNLGFVTDLKLQMTILRLLRAFTWLAGWHMKILLIFSLCVLKIYRIYKIKVLEI